MADIQKIRAEVLSVVSSKRWEMKVNAMSDKQVVSLYLSLKTQGKLNKEK